MIVRTSSRSLCSDFDVRPATDKMSPPNVLAIADAMERRVREVRRPHIRDGSAKPVVAVQTIGLTRVEAVGRGASCPTLGVGVCVRRLDWRTDHLCQVYQPRLRKWISRHGASGRAAARPDVENIHHTRLSAYGELVCAE